ncbi:hypothetical protein ABZ249_05880 [Nocardiopsis sp. NPDC006139]|uniref:hypothetical protein n=1 Tax=unclassified Nocardiopsis TaxID=2649073 RepID=UPI0033BB8DFD
MIETPRTPGAEEPETAGGPVGEDGGTGTAATPDTADGVESASGPAKSWAARVALVAAAGLVVGGTAYLGVEVADAFAPAATTGAAESGPDRDTGERRTTPLLADPGEGAPQGTGAGPEAGGEAAAPAQGPVDAPVEGTAPADGSGGTSGGEDPRAQILDDILNTPQERPPLVNDCDQACVDAQTAREEEGVEPVVVEFHPEDYEFPTTP